MSSRGKVWSTKKVNEEITKIEQGGQADYSPFADGKIDYRAPDIVFDYTDEELQEIAKCADDVVYFGENYCYSMTDEGISRIKLRGYQKKMLRDFQDNRFNVMVASRQIGKCASYSTKIKVKFPEQEVKEISLGNLYFIILKKERKLTFAEKIKWRLWKIYDWLD
jgi:hypothetical protein